MYGCRWLKLSVIALSASTGPVWPHPFLDHSNPEAFLEPAGLACLTPPDTDLAVAFTLTAVFNLAWFYKLLLLIELKNSYTKTFRVA